MTTHGNADYSIAEVFLSCLAVPEALIIKSLPNRHELVKVKE